MGRELHLASKNTHENSFSMSNLLIGHVVLKQLKIVLATYYLTRYSIPSIAMDGDFLSVLCNVIYKIELEPYVSAIS